MNINLIQQFSGLAMEKMPKVIGPKGHAIADYAMAAGAFAAAIAFFKANKKAAGVAALIAGVVEVVNPMITDFPGGVFKVISFPTHGRVDVGATTMVASLPKVMGLDGGIESNFFYIHAAAGMGVVAMTNFSGNGNTSPNGSPRPAESQT